MWQAKAMGDVLVVGLIPDHEILRAKGPPVLNEKERYTLVDAVKWVDEIITGGNWSVLAVQADECVLQTDNPQSWHPRVGVAGPQQVHCMSRC